MVLATIVTVFSELLGTLFLGQVNGFRIFVAVVLLIAVAYWVGRIEAWFKRWF